MKGIWQQKGGNVCWENISWDCLPWSVSTLTKSAAKILLYSHRWSTGCNNMGTYLEAGDGGFCDWKSWFMSLHHIELYCRSPVGFLDRSIPLRIGFMQSSWWENSPPYPSLLNLCNFSLGSSKPNGQSESSVNLFLLVEEVQFMPVKLLWTTKPKKTWNFFSEREKERDTGRGRGRRRERTREKEAEGGSCWWRGCWFNQRAADKFLAFPTLWVLLLVKCFSCLPSFTMWRKKHLAMPNLDVEHTPQKD